MKNDRGHQMNGKLTVGNAFNWIAPGRWPNENWLTIQVAGLRC